MHVIPQEFESVLQTSQRYKSGVNCPPNEAWKLIASIDKLKARPYLEGNEMVLGLLSQASKSYQAGLEISSNRSSYKTADVTRKFMEASDLILKAFNAYSSVKDMPVTNQNAVDGSQDVLSSASQVNDFMAPYYGDQSNQVKRNIRFVEKSETMPVVFQDGAITCNPRPAQFGKGLEAWMSFKQTPSTIWIIGRTGNAFDTNKDVIDFIRQFFPNLTFFNNIILFAREIAEWNNDLRNLAASTDSDPAFNPNAKAYGYKSNLDAMGIILNKLKKIGDNLKAIIARSLSVTSYSMFVIAMRAYMGTVMMGVNLVSRLRGENYYEGDPSKRNFLIEQMKLAYAEIDKEVGKGNPNDKFVAQKAAEISKLIDQILDVFEDEYKAYQTNMRAKLFLADSLTAKAGTIKADVDFEAIKANAMKVNAGAAIGYWAKAIIRGLVEITAWTAYNVTALSFDVVISGLTNALHLIIKLFDTLRVILIQRQAKQDPDRDQIAFYEYIKYQDMLAEKSQELETFSGQSYNRVAGRFKKYMTGLGYIVGRCKRMLEDDFLNDKSSDNYYDKYMRSYEGPASKGLEIIKDKVSGILKSIKRLVFIGIGAVAKLVDSKAFKYTVKTLLLTFINLAKILTAIVAEGLNVAEAMLKDEEVTTQTEKIVHLLRNISPESVIDEQTVQNLKDMFDPVFEKLQYFYNNPDVALRNVLESLKRAVGIQPSSPSISNTHHAGGNVQLSRAPSSAPAFASIMDSDSSKLIDTNMVGNADSEYGYVPSPLPVMGI